MDGLRAAFPGIPIVGEEDEDGVAALADAASWWPKGGGACPVSVRAADLPAELAGAALVDLVVFVDPLDGTREFVEGRLD